MADIKKPNRFEALLAEMRATAERAEALADAMEGQVKNQREAAEGVTVPPKIKN